MLEKSEGLVIKTTRYSESSVIARIFTREFGWLNFHIPGVRSSKNKSKGNLFQPLQYLEMDIYHHPGKNLMKIKDYRPGYIYRKLPFDMIRQSVAIFMLEVLSKCIHEEERNPLLYDFVRQQLIQLDEDERLDLMMPATFLLQLSTILGFQPLASDRDQAEYFHLEDGHFNEMAGHPEMTLDLKTSGVLKRILNDPSSVLTSQERQLLVDGFIRYFQIHIPGFKQPTSLDILRQVLR